jgi:small-conductance mechanosensitive channel
MSALIPSNTVFFALLLYAGWRYLVSFENRKYDANWETIPTKGKRRFVIMHYVLLRGVIITVVAIMYALQLASLWSLLLCVAIPVMWVMASAGSDEWRRREMDFIVDSVKRRKQN